MTYGLYNRRETVLVIGGIMLLHFLIIGLCIFWCWKFLWNDYDPGVFVLLVMFIGGLIICDILLARVQGVSRFLLRCNVDYAGIHCYMPFNKYWHIAWTDIRTYGLFGLNDPVSYIQCFFSADCSIMDRNQLATLSEKQISFQVNSPLYFAIMEYVPMDIKAKLLKTLAEGKDRVFRRTQL